MSVKLTKSEMAVAVARDVISQLRKRNNKMTVESGEYFSTSYILDETDGKFDLKDVLPDIMKAGCSVCARGAALISKARLFDNVPLDAISHSGYFNVSQEATTELLGSVFSEKTLDNIEAAFEIDYGLTENPTKQTYGAVVFGSKYKDKKKRLIAIMQNIIDNNGKFVVKPATQKRAEEIYHAF